MRSSARYLLALLAVLLFSTSFYIYIGRTQPDQVSATFYTHKNRSIAPKKFDAPEKNDLTDYKVADQTQEKASLNIDSDKVKRSKHGQHLSDTLDFPSRLAEFDFESCDMSTCFDFSLCNASDTLRVHIVASNRAIIPNISGESNIIHARILKIIRESKHYEPDPKRACLFIPEDDTLDRDPLSSSFRQSSSDIFKPEHRFGMNYLIFNLYSGTWPDYKENDFSGLRIGAAILAKASNSLAHHRDKFDISIPLFSYLHTVGHGASDDVQDPELLDRSHHKNKTHFLTFKGKRYVVGIGSESRNSLYHLNNQRDVIMLTTCRHGKKWREIDDGRCMDEDSSYERYDFAELMGSSTFCLTPRGRRLGSFRFLEALNYTCIPVVLGDGWVWPFDEIIDWSSAAIQFPENEIFLIPDTLRDYDEDRIRAMQLKCGRLYRKYFSTVEKIVMTTIGIIEGRIKRALDSRPL
jgi:glucuronyl/N-acetylglucosaminyl transferase EXT1